MAYIGNEPIVSATRTVTEVSATAGQTVFYPNGGYTVGKIDVIVNGAELNSSDFIATNGSSVTLTTACSVGDDVKLVAWGTFTTANIPSGSLTSGAPTWSPTGGVSLPRIDSSTEGGQLNFNRASDDTGSWYIDSYGSGSSPSLRFVDATSATVRMSIDGSGRVLKPYNPSFYAYWSNDSFNYGSGVTLWDTTRFNIGSHYNSTTGRFTAPISGTYQFNLQTQHYGGTSGNGFHDIRLNGSSTFNVRWEHQSGATYTGGGTSVAIYMNAGDYVDTWSNAPVWWSDNSCFSGFLVG